MGRLALCAAWLLVVHSSAEAALPRETPALRALLRSAGSDAPAPVAAPARKAVSDSMADAEARRRYECAAGPHGRGLSAVLALALTQACRSCAGSSEPCRYTCHELVADQRLPTPVARGYCN